MTSPAEPAPTRPAPKIRAELAASGPPLLVADSALVKVVVHARTATVTRRVEIDAAAPTARVAIAGVPERLELGSVRVETNAGLVRCVEQDTVEVEPDLLSDGVALAEVTRTMEARLHRLSGVLAGLEAELVLIDHVVPTASPLPGLPAAAPAPLRPDLFVLGLGIVEKRRKQTIHAIRRVQWERHQVQTELETLQARERMTGETGGAARTRAVLVVTLDVAARGRVALELSYELGWATWRPSYELRLDGATRTIELIRAAEVWQETGEDWQQVELALSSAQPQVDLRPPSLSPWVMGAATAFEDELQALYAERKQQRAARELGDDAFDDRSGPVSVADDFSAYAEQFEAEGIFAEATRAGVVRLRSGSRGSAVRPLPERSAADVEAAAAPQLMAARARRPRGPSADHPDFARLRSSQAPDAAGFDHQQRVPGATKLASGHERRRVVLGSQRYAARVEYLLRPAVAGHAYARVQAVNSEDCPLLQGPATIFAGETYCGETVLPGTPARGKLLIELGAETAIRCARRASNRFRSEGLLTKGDVHAVEVAIEVESYLSEEAELEVEDQLPLPLDPRLKVRLVASDPKDSVLDPITGIWRARLRVPACSKRVLGFRYEIEAPKDYVLTQSLME